MNRKTRIERIGFVVIAEKGWCDLGLGWQHPLWRGAN